MDHSNHQAGGAATNLKTISFWEYLQDTFSQYGFMPHGHCYLWKPLLVYMHVISDFLIGSAYILISVILYRLVKRTNISFNRMVLFFGLLFGACGLTHYMDIWNLWNADYWWSAWAKAITATASVGTGIYLFRLRHIIVQVIEQSRLAEQRRLDLEVLTRTLEERVKERTQLLKTITDNASSCLFMLDKNGCPTFMNPAAEKLTGFHLDEIKHKPLHETMGARTELVKETNHEDVFRDKGGRSFDVSYSVAPIETNGEITGSVMEFRDISEQKKAEGNILNALKVRDEFLSIASHELKTPLTTILIQSQFQKRLMEKNDPKAWNMERINHFADQSVTLAMRLNRIVDDMLDISRIRSGRLSLSKSEFDLLGMTEIILEQMKPQFLQAGYQVPTLQGEVAHGYWDPMRLEQVLNNLLINSIRYGNKRPVEVKIEKLVDRVRLSVKDQGIGISQEAQVRIFDRFERAANEISGLGLGLFISQQIIEAHNGKIWVESNPGEGSVFIFEIPLTESES